MEKGIKTIKVGILIFATILCAMGSAACSINNNMQEGTSSIHGALPTEEEAKDKEDMVVVEDNEEVYSIRYKKTIYTLDKRSNYLYLRDEDFKEKKLVDNTMKITGILIDQNELYYLDEAQGVERKVSLDAKTGRPQKDEVMTLMDKMSLEEKVGQLFVVAFRKTEEGKNLEVVDKSTKEKLQKYHVGGVVLFSENINSNEQTQKLIQDIKNECKISPFVAVDEEGGKVSRLTKSPNMKAVKLPGNAVIGESGDSKQAYETGRIIADELVALGFNMDFAPVADINTNPQNPVIGTRSFGSDPDLVAEMVAAMTKGMREQGVCAVLKHFPGHGDTSSDSHTGRATVSHTLDRLKEVEFIPFLKGIEQGADAVMTAHIQVPNVTGDTLPSTLSHYMLTDILRNELGYRKLIITDALDMGAITNEYTSEEAAVKALQAGADILLMPSDLDSAYHAVLKAVQTGGISEERIEESVIRILRIKEERGIIKHQ